MTTAGDHAFEVIIKSSGRRIRVSATTSILDALEAHGIVVASVCREGACGTCETGVFAGEVDHRDHVLGAEERAAATTMMVCVSRCRGQELVLDL